MSGVKINLEVHPDILAYVLDLFEVDEGEHVPEGLDAEFADFREQLDKLHNNFKPTHPDDKFNNEVDEKYLEDRDKS